MRDGAIPDVRAKFAVATDPEAHILAAGNTEYSVRFILFSYRSDNATTFFPGPPDGSAGFPGHDAGKDRGK